MVKLEIEMRRLTTEELEQISIPELTRLLFKYFKLRCGDKCSPQNIIGEFMNERETPPELRVKFQKKFQEALTILQRRGLIMQAFGQQIGHWFTLTSVGERSDLHEGILILIDDAQEIVNSVKEKVPNLDPVVEQYYLESIRACQEGLYISSVICLGAASERAINCLAEAVAKYKPDYREHIENKWNISALTRYLSQNIGQIFKGIADGAFISELKDKLEGAARIYRLNRNEAGHPKDIPQDWRRDEQESYLNQFRRYVVTIFKAIDILENTMSN